MGYFQAVCSFVIWGVTSTLVLRWVAVTPPMATFAGSLIGSAAMLALLSLRGGGRWREPLAIARRLPGKMTLQVCSYCGVSMSYQAAIQKTTIATAALTHSMQPVFTCLLLMPLVMRRLPTRLETAAVALGLVGMFVLLGPHSLDGAGTMGAVYGLLSALGYSISILNLSTFPKEIDKTALIAATLLFSLPIVGPLAIATGLPMFDLKSGALLLMYGVCNYACANVLWLAAMRRIPAGHLATLSYLEPLVAIAASVLWLGESAGVTTLAGAALILGSSGLIAFEGMSATKATKAREA